MVSFASSTCPPTILNLQLGCVLFPGRATGESDASSEQLPHALQSHWKIATAGTACILHAWAPDCCEAT
ncbi:hypothetical protein LZ30DRAFT_734238 [Colletotrichum cereale]|nr:hypothetical protein LZ30DRAFT_734238 [Colletotrichum cereale]